MDASKEPKYIGFYREFFEDDGSEFVRSLPWMRDNLADGPVPHEEDILAYLRSDGDYIALAPGWEFDVFTGENTGITSGIRTDGDYSWSKGLPYYVEKYHLILPEDFVQHILKKSGKA